MTEPGEPTGRPAIPSAVVQQRSSFSIVWVIPVIAALVGAFLVFKALSESGPEVTISFRTAEGIVAGQTKVRFKDVEIGVVESVELTEDISRVKITASLAPSARRYLTDYTRFWVVRARVTASQISGLSTVFSGAYIAIDPSTEGEERREFFGLESPPVVTHDEAGSTFTLRANELGSVDLGSPVYFRWIQVGEIASYELDEETDEVNVQVFVRSPYDSRVGKGTRWWNASGIDFSVNTEGIQIDTASVITMLIGGIAFETPADDEAREPVPDDMVFRLYPNKRATSIPQYTTKQRYLLHFQQSVAGLVPGSSVEFRGIRLGEVVEISLVYDIEKGEAMVPVVIELEPERITMIGEVPVDLADQQMHLGHLVHRGMRAQLSTASLLTGRLAVGLDFHPHAPPAELTLGGRYPEIPTLPGGLDEVLHSINRIAAKINEIPVERIGAELAQSLENLNATLIELRGMGEQVNREIGPQLLLTLQRAENTLASTDSIVDPNSPAGRELRRMIQELSEAARSIRLLADHLEQHPEDLLRGKSR